MVHVIDNVLPEELYTELLKTYNNPAMQYGWKSSRDGADPHGHWNIQLAPGGSVNLADISDKFDPLLKKVWNHVKENCPDMANTVPIRCYINGSTYGVEGYFHTDSMRNNETTIVIYLTDTWDINWAGETVVVDQNDDIVKAVIPKKNRAFIFPANMKHCARAVSRQCYALRKTFMFKTRNIRSNKIIIK